LFYTLAFAKSLGQFEMLHTHIDTHTHTFGIFLEFIQNGRLNRMAAWRRRCV